MNKRSHIHKKADSSASNPVLGQFQSRPFIAQAKPQLQKPLTQTETENQEFQQQKFEATKLKLQAKFGTITPEGQERLTEVQAKMSGTLQRRLEQASSNGSNFANIPISRPDAPSQQVVQTKLTIGEPGDKFEIAADKAAEDFVNRYHEHAPVSQQAQQNLQLEDMSVEEKELQGKPMLQLRLAKEGMTAAPEVEAAIQQARGSGQTMPDKIRKPHEQHAGADYSRVKIHTDRRADQINRWIGAEASAIGTDVFFRQGNFRPGTKKGDELLRHELEHVRQQNGSEVQSKPTIQLMQTNEVEIGKKYQYNDFNENIQKEGFLKEIKTGGWYDFENGRARGASNITQELENEQAISKMFKNYVQETGITDQGIINLMLDLNENEIMNAKINGILEFYKENWTDYTSCFNTAEKLFNLLGNQANLATNTWDQRQPMVNGIPALVADIKEMERRDAACIYRIGIKRSNSQDHSFVIVIQNKSAEILQSFAGAQGEALGENLINKKGQYSIDYITSILNKLIHNEDRVRADSMEKLFGGRIDVDHINGQDQIRNLLTDGFFIQIDRRGMYNPATLQEKIRQKIQQNLQALQ